MTHKEALQKAFEQLLEQIPDDFGDDINIIVASKLEPNNGFTMFTTEIIKDSKSSGYAVGEISRIVHESS